MKVVFIKDIKNIGRRGDIKEVADGYAKNFLLPKKFALPATAQVMVKIDQERTVIENKVAVLQEIVKQLESIGPLVFWLKSGKKGEIYGSVTGSQIEQVLHEKGFTGVEVILEKPIKEVGESKVGVSIGKGVIGNIKVLVNPVIPA